MAISVHVNTVRLPACACLHDALAVQPQLDLGIRRRSGAAASPRGRPRRLVLFPRSTGRSVVGTVGNARRYTQV